LAERTNVEFIRFKYDQSKAMIINAFELKSTLINADNQQGSPLKRMKNTVYDPSTTTRRISFTQDNDMV
jgi:hypothetical protein